MLTRAEAERFVTERQIPRVVMAYDVTLSAPESVSILWNTGGQEMGPRRPGVASSPPSCPWMGMDTRGEPTSRRVVGGNGGPSPDWTIWLNQMFSSAN
jgi:hypothetical protein